MFARAALIGAFASLAAFMADAADARPGRAGGGIGMSRSGGFGGLNRGRLGGHSQPQGVQRPSELANQRPAGRPAQQAQAGPRCAGHEAASGRPANSTIASRGNSGINGGTTINQGNRNTGINGGNTTGINRGNGSGNTGINGNNVNNVNNGNVVAGNNVDVDVDNGWGGSGDYPAGAAYATGVAVGTTATAAAVGTYYSTLPASCSPYVWNSVSYYTCAGNWFVPQYRGSTVVYVSVDNPTK